MISYHNTFKNRLWRIFSMFTITFSYSAYAVNNGLSSIKYIGILIFIYETIVKEIINHGFSMRKDYVQVLFFLIFYFGFCSIFQDNGILGFIQSIAYALFIGCVILFSDRVADSVGSIIALAIGIFIGIIASIISTDGSFIAIGTGRLRVYGGFAHPNTFGAAAMAVFICMIIALFYGKVKLKNNIPLLVIAAICAYFCYLSDSTNALYGILIFTALILYYKLAENFDLPRWVTILILIFIVVIAVNFIISEVGTDKIEGRTSTFFSIEFDNLRQFLIGDGLVGLSERADYGTEFALSAMLIKTGILGMVVFGGIFIFFYFRSRLNRNSHLFNALLITFLFTCVAEAYITNITNIYSVIMWILVSATSNGVLSDSENEFPKICKKVNYHAIGVFKQNRH